MSSVSWKSLTGPNCPGRCPPLMGSRGKLTYTVCSVQFFQIRQALGSCVFCRKPCSALAHFHASSVDLGPPLESCLRRHCSHSGDSGFRLLSQALRRGENILGTHSLRGGKCAGPCGPATLSLCGRCQPPSSHHCLPESSLHTPSTQFQSCQQVPKI